MSLTSEEQAVVASLRQQYVESGAPRGPLCNSVVCVNLATVRVFWPVLRGQSYPVYCPDCAKVAARVLDVLGFDYRDERLPEVVPGAVRGITIRGRL